MRGGSGGCYADIGIMRATQLMGADTCPGVVRGPGIVHGSTGELGRMPKASIACLPRWAWAKYATASAVDAECTQASCP